MNGPSYPTHTTHCTHSGLFRQLLPFPFVCFDLEWQTLPDLRGNQFIKAVSFVDSNGCKKVLLIEDYQPTRDLFCNDRGNSISLCDII